MYYLGEKNESPISSLFSPKKEGRGLIFTGKFPIKQKLSPLTEVVYYIKNPFPGNFPFYPKFPFNRFPIIRSTLYYLYYSMYNSSYSQAQLKLGGSGGCEWMDG